MTGGGIECVLRSVSDHHWGCEVRCEVSPLAGPCACLHHWLAKTRRETSRSTHRCSEQAGAIGVVVRLRRGYGRRLMAPCGHPIHH